MRIHVVVAFFLSFVLSLRPAQADSRIIVRVNGGSVTISSICFSLGCTVAEGLGDPLGQLFLVTSTTTDSPTLLAELSSFSAVVDSESDQIAHSAQSNVAAPASLTDTSPVDYFGVSVPHGYVSQPAVGLVRVAEARTSFGVQGAGTVAVIDTGVDPDHPALSPVLLPGYDFTRNRNGADERLDLALSSSPSSGAPAWVSQTAIANLSQSTAAVVDGSGSYSNFGHGTMVAGVIHLIAPAAHILPFKVFRSDGNRVHLRCPSCHLSVCTEQSQRDQHEL